MNKQIVETSIVFVTRQHPIFYMVQKSLAQMGVVDKDDGIVRSEAAIIYAKFFYEDIDIEFHVLKEDSIKIVLRNKPVNTAPYEGILNDKLEQRVEKFLPILSTLDCTTLGLNIKYVDADYTGPDMKGNISSMIFTINDYSFSHPTTFSVERGILVMDDNSERDVFAIDANINIVKPENTNDKQGIRWIKDTIDRRSDFINEILGGAII